jgi:class 3 adenylate cyclase
MSRFAPTAGAVYATVGEENTLVCGEGSGAFVTRQTPAPTLTAMSAMKGARRAAVPGRSATADEQPPRTVRFAPLPAAAGADDAALMEALFAPQQGPGGDASFIEDEDAEHGPLGASASESGASNSHSDSDTGARTSASEGSVDKDVHELDAAVEATMADYELSALSLTFVSAESEARYVEYTTQLANFAAGKLYVFVGGLLLAALVLPYVSWDPTWEKLTNVFLSAMLAGAVVSWAVVVLLFVNTKPRVREGLFMFIVAVHWPIFAAATVRGKEDEMYKYGYTMGCYWFCCFVAQPRFIVMAAAMGVTPLVTFFAVTYGDVGADYWASRSRFEMLLWPTMVFPLALLRVFERRAREAFVEAERGRALMAVLAQRSVMTRRIIARFFPLTASVRLLRSRGRDQYAVYPNTCVVVTDVAGFTAWASRTSADMVVRKVSAMFVAMERAARRYGVEKVSTVGDSYVGAAFPPASAVLVGANVTAEEVVERHHTSSDTKSRSGSHTGSHSAASSRGRRALGASGHSTASSTGTGSGASAAALGLTSVEDGEAESPPGSPGSEGLELVDPLTAQRCHRTLRFATAVRHHREVMPVRIGVHVGPVIGGFVGIQPPKFDLFGATVATTQQLEATGRRSRVHASHAALELAAEFGRPSDDFEPTALGMYFSTWSSEPGATAGDGKGDEESPRRPAASAARMTRAAAEANGPEHGAEYVEERALVLCGHIARFGSAQQDKAIRGFETRESRLRATLVKLATTRSMDADEEEGEDATEESGAGGGAASEGRPLLGRGAHTPGNGNGDPDGNGDADGDAGEEELVSLDGYRQDSDDDAGFFDDGGSQQQAGAEGAAPGCGDGELGDDAVLSIEREGDEEALYVFSIFTLTFDDPKVEAQYLRRYVKSELATSIFTVTTLASIYWLVCHVANACTNSVNNKLLVVIASTVFILYLVILREFGTAHGWNAAVAWAFYWGAVWPMVMLYEPGCPEVPNQNIASSTITGAAGLTVCYLGFSLELNLPRRTLFLICNAAMMQAIIAARKLGIEHGSGTESPVATWTAIPALICVAMVFVSYFADFILRAGFQATMRRRALQSNRTRHAEQSAAALDMMLPSFVAERLIKAARGGGGVDMSDVASQASGVSTGSAMSRLSAGSSTSRRSTGSAQRVSGDAAHGMLTRRSEQVWPYPRAVVMFVRFEPPVLTYGAVVDTVTRIEAVARGRSIQKVKTIGTTVLLVAGLERSISFDDAAVNCVEAALEVRRRVFPAGLSEGWSFAVGLNAGPVFGAVIGSQGLAFDIYGDTVNTASRMCTTAGSGAIRCTQMLRQALPADDGSLDFAVEGVAEAVLVKGKGAMHVCEVRERRGGAGGGDGGAGAHEVRLDAPAHAAAAAAGDESRTAGGRGRQKTRASPLLVAVPSQGSRRASLPHTPVPQHDDDGGDGGDDGGGGGSHTEDETTEPMMPAAAVLGRAGSDADMIALATPNVLIASSM